jgi:hypothetical protein
MRNKKMTFFLIPLVILIWGILFIRLYKNFGPKGNLLKNYSHETTAKIIVENDTVMRLKLNYPDPFLKTKERKLNSVGHSSNEISNNKSIVNWPVIEYHGFLGKNSTEATGLLKIGESNLLVKQNLVYSGIKIHSITKDSIYVEYEKEKRWLLKLE